MPNRVHGPSVMPNCELLILKKKRNVKKCYCKKDYIDYFIISNVVFQILMLTYHLFCF